MLNFDTNATKEKIKKQEETHLSRKTEQKKKKEKKKDEKHEKKKKKGKEVSEEYPGTAQSLFARNPEAVEAKKNQILSAREKKKKNKNKEARK